jgi:hypothetical protein
MEEVLDTSILNEENGMMLKIETEQFIFKDDENGI